MSGKTALLTLTSALLLHCSGEAPALPAMMMPMPAPGPTPPKEMPPELPQPTRLPPGTFVRIAPGSFFMGTSTGDECRRTNNEDRHRVTLTHAFELSTTEVTKGQYQQLMGEDPGAFPECGASCPVDQRSWHHAAAYANAASTYAGLPSCYLCTGSGDGQRCTARGEAGTIYTCAGYRLPTEAEWEFAYRAGLDAATYKGNLTTCSELDPAMNDIAWFLRNGEGRIHEVGKKTPNALGLYDMSGNVWEWTHDLYQTSLKEAVDPVGVAVMKGDEELRILRGGSYNCLPSESRASHRSAIPGTIAALNVGFRLARTVRIVHVAVRAERPLGDRRSAQPEKQRRPRG